MTNKKNKRINLIDTIFYIIGIGALSVLIIGTIKAMNDDKITVEHSNITNKEKKPTTTQTTTIKTTKKSATQSTTNQGQYNTTKRFQETTTEKVTTTTQKQTEYIAAIIEYSCPDGYTLSNSLCITNIYSNHKVRYYCTTGYLSGLYCEYEAEVPVSYSYSAKASCSNYANTGMYEKCQCEKSSGIWSFGRCVKKQTKRTPANEEYYCDYGYTMTEDNRCVKEEFIVASINYTCPEGYKLNGNICYK